MAMKLFDLAQLATMDGGRCGEAFMQALQRLQWDLEERPNVKAARVLVLRLSLTPIPGETGRLEGADVDFAFEEKVPKRKSYPYRMKPGAKGFVFSDFAPENADQRTIEGALEDAEGKRSDAR